MLGSQQDDRQQRYQTKKRLFRSSACRILGILRTYRGAEVQGRPTENFSAVGENRTPNGSGVPTREGQEKGSPD